jgi:hypothetical protein
VKVRRADVGQEYNRKDHGRCWIVGYIKTEREGIKRAIGIAPKLGREQRRDSTEIQGLATGTLARQGVTTQTWTPKRNHQKLSAKTTTKIIQTKHELKSID